MGRQKGFKMKEDELREAAICGLCENGIGGSKVPFFMRVTIKRYGLNARSLMGQQGLTMQLCGNGHLARIMGPNDDMAEIIDENTITVCYNCAKKNNIIFDILLAESD